MCKAEQKKHISQMTFIIFCKLTLNMYDDRKGCLLLSTSISLSHTHTHTRLTALCPGLPG